MLRRRQLMPRRRLEELGSVTLTFTSTLIGPVAAPAPKDPSAEPAITPFTAPFFAPFTTRFLAPLTSIVAMTFMPNIDTDLLYDFLRGGLLLPR